MLLLSFNSSVYKVWAGGGWLENLILMKAQSSVWTWTWTLDFDLGFVKKNKTSVALATESSGYVWFRAPVILVNLLILIGISKIIIVGFPYQRTYSYNIDHLCYCWETIYIHSNILGI